LSHVLLSFCLLLCAFPSFFSFLLLPRFVAFLRPTLDFFSPIQHENDSSSASSDDVRRDYAPQGVSTATGLFATLKRTVAEFQEDNLSDWAAALTYYGLLSLFPALIAMISLIGIFGDPKGTTDSLTEIITEIGPASAAETFSGPIESIAESRGTAGLALVLGLAAALWSASGYVGAFTRASNIIYETPEGRPFWKLRPLQIAVTLGMIILMALLALGLVLTGPVVEAVAGPIGLDDTAITVWNIAKWPVMVAIFIVMVDVLYYATPNVKMRGFKWVTAGSVVATADAAGKGGGHEEKGGKRIRQKNVKMR